MGEGKGKRFSQIASNRSVAGGTRASDIPWPTYHGWEWRKVMKKGAGKMPAPSPDRRRKSIRKALQRLDADGFQTLLALLNLHADPLIFLQRTNARTLDGGDMDEDVLA